VFSRSVAVLFAGVPVPTNKTGRYLIGISKAPPHQLRIRSSRTKKVKNYRFTERPERRQMKERCYWRQKRRQTAKYLMSTLNFRRRLLELRRISLAINCFKYMNAAFQQDDLVSRMS